MSPNARAPQVVATARERRRPGALGMELLPVVGSVANQRKRGGGGDEGGWRPWALQSALPRDGHRCGVARKGGGNRPAVNG